MLPSNPQFKEPAEAFVSTPNEGRCSDASHPGVVAFKNFMLKHQGGANIGMSRPCVADKTSGHFSGRAWDWKLNAFNPDEKAIADETIAWLLANDAEVFRRAGLVYLIFNKRIWTAGTKAWRPYPIVPAAGKSPHTDHVHFSFSDAGADGLTSFYRWLDDPGQGPPLPPPNLPPNLPPTTPPAPSYAGAMIGALAGFYIVYQLIKR